MQNPRLLAGAVVAGLALLTGCAGNSVDSSNSSANDSAGTSSSPGASAKGAVRITGQNFPEGEIVSDLYAGVLKKAGYQPQVKLVGTRDVYMAAFPKGIDVVPEYTGGIVDFLIAQDKGAKAPVPTSSDPAVVIKQVEPLLKKSGISLLAPSPATNTNAFFVTQKYSDDNHVTKLSDLQGKSVALAAAPDCQGRLDCEGGLSGTYGIKITKIVPLQFGSQQTYDSVLKNEVQLGETSSTDGTLASQGLVLLADDKHIQPAQNLVPMVSAGFLQAHPDVAAPLNELMSKLSTAELTTLNAKVSVDREKPDQVASDWLSQQGLS